MNDQPHRYFIPHPPSLTLSSDYQHRERWQLMSRPRAFPWMEMRAFEADKLPMKMNGRFWGAVRSA